MGHYQQFIKGFAQIAQSLKEHLAGEGASRKTEQVSLSGDVLGAFKTLKQVCMSAPILSFTDYTKDFLLKTGTSKEGLEVVLSQNKHMGNINQLPMAARPLQPMKRTIILQNSNF